MNKHNKKMEHFEITGWMTNGLGETVSITIYNKKSGDIFFVGSEQAKSLADILQKHLIPKAVKNGYKDVIK